MRRCALAVAGLALSIGLVSTDSQRHQILFNHVGKAGGGSVRSTLFDSLLLHSTFCCSGNKLVDVWHPYGYLEPKLAYPYIVLNVRDPVDRFASAFDWRSLVYCHPWKYEKRKRVKEKPGANERHIKCLASDASKEHQMLLRYNWSKSVFAQNMLSTDPALRDTAMEDIKQLQHAKVGLWERSGGLETVNKLVAKGVKIYAVAIADGFDFDAQIEAAFYDIVQNIMQHESWLKLNSAQKSEVYNALTFLKGKLDARKTALSSPANGTTTKLCSVNTKSKASGCHSSDSKTVLSADKRAPLATYYEGDYDIIDRLQQVGCHGELAGTCRGALASILAARPVAKDEGLPRVERLPDSTAYFYKGGRWLDSFFAGVTGPARCAKLIQQEPSCNQEWFSHGTNTDGNCWCAPVTMADGFDRSNWVNVKDAAAQDDDSFSYTRNGDERSKKKQKTKANRWSMSAGLYRIM